MAVEQTGYFRSRAEVSLNRDQRASFRDPLGIDSRIRFQDRALRDGRGKVVNVGFAARGRTDDENVFVADSLVLEVLYGRLGVRAIGIQSGYCLCHFAFTLVVRPRKGFRPKFPQARTSAHATVQET